MRIPSIINPISNDYHCIQTLKKELNVAQIVAAIAAAIFASVIPVIGTTYAFRKVVLHFNQSIQAEKAIHLEKAWIESDKVRQDLMAGSADEILMKKLSKLGIGPQNSPLKHLWIVHYRTGCANQLFGPECQGQFLRDMHSDIERELKERTGLFIFTTEKIFFKEMQHLLKNNPSYIDLTLDEMYGDAALPERFVNLVRNGF